MAAKEPWGLKPGLKIHRRSLVSEHPESGHGGGVSVCLATASTPYPVPSLGLWWLEGQYVILFMSKGTAIPVSHPIGVLLRGAGVTAVILADALGN